MKQVFTIVFFSLCTLQSFSQSGSKVFDEVKEITVRNVGVIRKNNEIKGYFSFYEYDKVDKNTILFKLNLMDENLNQLGTKEIEGPKTWELISSGFDGNNFCFKFFDPKAKTFELKVYNQEAKEVNSSELEVVLKDNSLSYRMYRYNTKVELNILPDNGFVNYAFDNDDNSFSTTYINGSPKRKWQRVYPNGGDFKAIVPSFVGSNSDMMITFIAKVGKGPYTTSSDNFILASSIAGGGKLFEVPATANGKNFVPVNVTFDSGKIIMVGLNYPNKDVLTGGPEGLSFVEMDLKGKILKSESQTFEESLGKYFPMEKKKLAGDYLFYVHGIEKTKNNTYLVAGEKFKKKTSAGGAAVTILTQGSGGFVKLELENMIVIEFDADGKIMQAQEIPKAKGYTPQFPSFLGFFPPYTLASTANGLGWLDYMYSLKNEDKSEITFSFLDYEKLEDDDKKTHNFGQIKYKNGVITSDKVAIKNDKATFTHLYPAKAGYVLQMNYFKKKKQITMDFIKLN